MLEVLNVGNNRFNDIFPPGYRDYSKSKTAYTTIQQPPWNDHNYQLYYWFVKTFDQGIFKGRKKGRGVAGEAGCLGSMS